MTDLIPDDLRIVLAQHALAELDEAARTLHAAGHEPLSILGELFCLQERHRLLGTGLPATAALRAIRCLPGLGEWDPLDAWAADAAACDPEALVGGLESPTALEDERRQRASALALWLQRHAETALAESIVNAAERLAFAEIGGAP